MTYYESIVQKLLTHYPDASVCERVVRARKIMDEDFAQSLTLDRIAEAACISRFHFIRVFRKLYGQTPHQYLMSVRLAHARAALGSDTSVLDACHSVGLSSVTTFARRFKNYTGHSPSSYRRLRK